MHVGGLTIVSRMLGIVREILQANFLGVGIMSDAFITAFRIPNFLRKVFAEGAVTSSFVPHIVGLTKFGKKKAAATLMTLAFIVFEGTVLILCVGVFLWPNAIIKFMAPGFGEQQVAHAIPMLRIMFPFIFFISSCALFSGALQAVNHFLIPALGPVLLNIVFISTLLLCIKFKFSPLVLCAGVLVGGATKLIARIIAFWWEGLSFGPINREGFKDLAIVLKRFMPCLLSAGIVEINLFIDSMIGSYLPRGGITLLYYAYRFLLMPISIFSLALSTVLLPHYSRVALYAKKRLSFYMLETTKVVLWMTLPAALYLAYSAEPIFSTLMLRGRGTPDQISMAAMLLIIFTTSLPFLCVNRTLLSMYYALHDTWTPTWVTIIATVSNGIGNVIGIHLWGAQGIAISTVVSGLITTGLFVTLLHKKHKIILYPGNVGKFLSKYLLQVALGTAAFLVLHKSSLALVAKTPLHNFFLHDLGYWIISLPLFAGVMGILLLTRKWFGIAPYFLDHSKVQ